MLFLSDKGFKVGMYAAIILFTAGIGTLALMSPHGIGNFITYTFDIFQKYWPVLIILLAVIALVNKDTKGKKKEVV
jgi:hypothetical protein